jgi:hypothetical protein
MAMKTNNIMSPKTQTCSNAAIVIYKCSVINKVLNHVVDYVIIDLFHENTFHKKK